MACNNKDIQSYLLHLKRKKKRVAANIHDNVIRIYVNQGLISGQRKLQIHNYFY